MTLPIGLQLYTVRDALTDDFAGTLKRVAEIGYTHVELAGLYDHTPDEAKAALDDAGLTPIASHEPFTRIATGAAARQAKKLGYAVIVAPWLPESERTEAGYTAARDSLTLAAAEAPAYTFAYHNHDFEFETLPDGRLPMDLIFNDNTVAAELDTCWAAVAGHDPVEWMRKLAGRLPIIHIKDCSDYDAKTLCELGAGQVDLPAIVAAAPDCGVQCLVIEQDHGWVDNDCLKSATQSYIHLRALLDSSK